MYFKTAEKNIDYKDEAIVAESYAQGFLFGRIEPGYMYQTRSLRIDLSVFQPTSENRRILKKFNNQISALKLPIIDKYDWQIHKLGKDFYSKKFPDETFSANKIKELLTTENQFNLLLKYSPDKSAVPQSNAYAICHSNPSLLHYCYPFYDLDGNHNNLGMYMMLQAILWAQIHGKRYCYLGGVTRPADIYKLQFKGLEWWNNDGWDHDLEKVKFILADSTKF